MEGTRSAMARPLRMLILAGRPSRVPRRSAPDMTGRRPGGPGPCPGRCPGRRTRFRSQKFSP